MTSTEWIADFLANDPPRSKSLVMTIFGDTIAPHGGTVWLGSLIELLAPFGINDRLLRTCVFRLAQEGWLVANRDGRRSSYALLPQALPRFERANRRIYAPLTAHWDGNWTMLLAPASAVDAPHPRPAAQGTGVGRLCDDFKRDLRPPGRQSRRDRGNPGAPRRARQAAGVPQQRAGRLCRAYPCANWRPRAGTCRPWSQATTASSTTSGHCWRCWPKAKRRAAASLRDPSRS
ncbi:hypothetical protein LP420_25380 [Massilia sp. B-10]|nr:hypothetical protein LP420_25380 [Massilia sp. B-10]